METNRRSFVGGLLALTMGAGAADRCTSDLPADVAKLCHWYGQDAVLRHLQEMLAAGEDITFRSLRSHCGREKRRNTRQAAARMRRERHADQVIYRGAVVIPHLSDLLIGCRPVTSAISRHCLLIGSISGFWLGETQLPRGTRLLVDNRRPLRSPCMGEFVRTGKDRFCHRLHLYTPSQWSDDCNPAERAWVLTADPPVRVRLPDAKLDELYAVQDDLGD